MLDDIQSVLLTETQLEERVAELGAAISADFEGKDVVTIPCSMDFMAVSSYGGGTVSTGAVKINKDLSQDIAGKHVIFVEDILDSGVTLSYLKSYLMVRQPASISIATLMDKPARRKAEVKADYAGFIVPDAFVVGYGLDYDEKYRNLPFVGILKPEIYS